MKQAVSTHYALPASFIEQTTTYWRRLEENLITCELFNGFAEYFNSLVAIVVG